MDIMRGALRVAVTTIRKLKTHQKVDTGPVLRKLAAIRSEAKGVWDDVKTPPK